MTPGDFKQSGSGKHHDEHEHDGDCSKIRFQTGCCGTPGDWKRVSSGFGTNILVNMLGADRVCCGFVLKMPDSLVFGPHPAGARADDVPLDLLLCVAGPYRLAQKTGAHRRLRAGLPASACRNMFIVTFVIMLPITIKTGDPMKGAGPPAWSWVFFQSFYILMIGGFIAAIHSKDYTRAPPCSARLCRCPP